MVMLASPLKNTIIAIKKTFSPNNKNKVEVTYETNTRINKLADNDTCCSCG